MKIVNANPNNITQKFVDLTVRILKNQGIIIYPSDTCYGMGGNANNSEVIDRISKIKNRHIDQLYSVIVKDIDYIKKVAKVDQKQTKILEQHLPGPFTFVLKLKNSNDTLGFRIPKLKFTQYLMNRIDFPLITTSANVHSNPNPYSLKDLNRDILAQKANQKLINLVIDMGELPQRVPSTVVDITDSGHPKVLRQGSGQLKL